jgi:hypothetical protein
MRHTAVGIVLLFSVACESGPAPSYVSRAEFGDKWPLTVDEGVTRLSRLMLPPPAWGSMMAGDARVAVASPRRCAVQQYPSRDRS